MKYGNAVLILLFCLCVSGLSQELQFNSSNHFSFDNGKLNEFVNNYWDDWTEPDANGDGVVDHAYSIDGEAGSQDTHPQASPNPGSTPKYPLKYILGIPSSNNNSSSSRAINSKTEEYVESISSF